MRVFGRSIDSMHELAFAAYFHFGKLCEVAAVFGFARSDELYSHLFQSVGIGDECEVAHRHGGGKGYTCGNRYLCYAECAAAFACGMYAEVVVGGVVDSYGEGLCPKAVARIFAEVRCARRQKGCCHGLGIFFVAEHNFEAGVIGCKDELCHDDCHLICLAGLKGNTRTDEPVVMCS